MATHMRCWGSCDAVTECDITFSSFNTTVLNNNTAKCKVCGWEGRIE